MPLPKTIFIILISLLLAACSLKQADEAKYTYISKESLQKYQQAKTSYIKGDDKTALEILSSIEKESPLFTPALELTGRIHFFQGNIAEAEKHFLKAHDQNPHNINPGKWLCRTYLLKGDLNKAAAVLKMLTEASPEDTSLLILNGKIMKERQNYLEALEYYKKSFLIEDELAEAHLDLADIYASFSLDSKAAGELKKSLNILGEDHALYKSVKAVYDRMR
ncbi:MAG: tetratricopeptide repeat protein [Spirochaetia bacterium]|jgi:Flp pilus assembly protein TadD|nr:tetratricopeptide repeat protein [Spirochaetia bacterium]